MKVYSLLPPGGRAHLHPAARAEDKELTLIFALTQVS